MKNNSDNAQIPESCLASVSGSGEVDKELANWIYYEDGHTFYCSDCCQKRVEEINTNKEFSEDINYEDGDECGYFQDYAFQDYEVECCKCSKPLFSEVDC